MGTEATNIIHGERVEDTEWVQKTLDIGREELSQRVQALNITLSTLLRGVWSLVLSQYTCEDTVLFGGVVSGRNLHVEGIETMLGMSVNVLPIVVRMDASHSISSWLKLLQKEFSQMAAFEQCTREDMCKWVGGTLTPETLFQTTMAFQNFPALQQHVETETETESESENGSEHEHEEGTNVAVGVDSSIEIEMLDPVGTVPTPLGAAFAPTRDAEHLIVKIMFDTRHHEAVHVEQLLAHVEQTMTRLLYCDPSERLTALVSVHPQS